jgi:TPR repeat protein
MAAHAQATAEAAAHAEAFLRARVEEEEALAYGAGDATALTGMGLRYKYGEGVKADLKQAVQCFSAAATSGLGEAQYQLAIMLLDGAGVVQNSKEGAVWLERAVDQGHPGACAALAGCYERGVGVSRSMEEACRLHARSFALSQQRSRLAMASVHIAWQDVHHAWESSAAAWSGSVLAYDTLWQAAQGGGPGWACASEVWTRACGQWEAAVGDWAAASHMAEGAIARGSQQLDGVDVIEGQGPVGPRTET